MKKLLALFCLLAFGIPVHAAIAVVQTNCHSNAFTGVTTGTATSSLTNPVASGNAVLLAFGGGGNASALTPGTVTDNKGDSYSTPTYDTTLTKGQGFFLSTNITTGPNTSFSVPFTTPASSPTIVICAYEISGLTGSPVDYAATAQTSFGATFTRSFTTTTAGEEGFAIMGSGQPAVTMTNGWTNDGSFLSGTPNSAFAHNALPTSGSNSINGSSSGSDIWSITVVSLTPSAGATCTNNFWSSTGAYAIPNGTTGSYWSTTGVFATPNCSTGSYWLKSGAKGAN